MFQGIYIGEIYCTHQRIKWKFNRLFRSALALFAQMKTILVRNNLYSTWVWVYITHIRSLLLLSWLKSCLPQSHRAHNICVSQPLCRLVRCANNAPVIDAQQNDFCFFSFIFIFIQPDQNIYYTFCVQILANTDSSRCGHRRRNNNSSSHDLIFA